MSQFAFPRLNVKGLAAINVGTANNDDYSGNYFLNSNMPLRLSDSVEVEADTYNQADQNYIKWVQTPGTFANNPTQAARMKDANTSQVLLSANNQTTTIIPAEWNYYGDMGVSFNNVNIVGIQLPNQLLTTPAQNPWIGAEISFKNRPDNTGRSTALMIDVDPEAVPSSQIFADSLMIQQNGQIIMSGKPSKASTRWINFQRNTVLTASAGASATFQCVVPLSELQNQPIVAFFNKYSAKPIDGIVFRYNFFRSIPPINAGRYPGQAYFDQMVALYQKQGINPMISEVIGTVAPWYANEMQSVTMARQLIPLPPPQSTFPSPGGNGNVFQLAPAILQINQTLNMVSVDLSNTFPESYTGNYDPTQTGNNEKFGLGTLTLCLNNAKQVIGQINNTRAFYDPRGGMYDFAIPPQYASQVASGTFMIFSSKYPSSPLLNETDYMVASDQSTIYTDQSTNGQLTNSFLFQGTNVPVTFGIYYKGQPCTTNIPAVTLQQFTTDPNQATGNLAPLKTYPNLKPNQPLAIDTSMFGVQIFNIALPGQTVSNLNGLNLNSSQLISLRILKYEDFSQYYVNPKDPNPVGNDLLTFDVIYQNVFRNYYLLYPAMGQLTIPMNDASYWEDPEMAGRLYQRISAQGWGAATYMPRTRDLSASRRQLVQAWCMKILTASSTAAPATPPTA